MSQNPVVTPLNTENKPEEPKVEEPKNSALTRLIVKNIPKTLDELSLKKLFEKFGEVTDCQIIFKGEINRQFAFIGFRDINSSEKAKLKMNNTFIKSSKVTVDFAVEKTPLPKPNPRNKSIPKQIKAETEKIGQQNSEQNLKVASFEIDEKRLYVTNLPYSVTNEDLAQVFSKIGKVESAKIIVKNNQSCGYGFINFEDENSSIRAIHELDKKNIFGRPIGLSQCRKSTNPAISNIDKKVEAEKSSFKKLKKQKLLERLHDDVNWNSSFLNPNTILERISEKLGVSKKALLDNEIENPAVIKTICEKEILDEVYEYLVANNVNISVFKNPKQSAQKSKTIILIKNLPFKTKSQKIEDLLSQYGRVENFLITPNRAIAIVEYQDADHANNAFNTLGDYVYQGTPLYLEWAPLGLYTEAVLGKREMMDEKAVEADVKEDVKTNENVVYIKNLNLTTTENEVEEMLISSDLKDFKFVKIIRKDGKSMGYGFVEFESSENAEKMIKKYQGFILQNHSLKLSISRPKNKEKETEKKEVNLNQIKTDKLVIKNLPFQTNKQELISLIKGIVNAKNIRLPQKTDGSLKGFAFVQFGSIDEAAGAYEALQNLHFYGRKLVLEFAKE